MESLTRTDVAQPALFSLSLALTDAARDVGLRPDFVAGHSLGEYTAAVAAGALDPDDGVRLVCERGRLMAEIQSESPGAMAAIIGLDAETLGELCEQASDAGLGRARQPQLAHPDRRLGRGGRRGAADASWRSRPAPGAPCRCRSAPPSTAS